MAAAEVKGGQKKSKDRDDENFKNEEKPFHVLIVLAALENQELITPTQRTIIVGVGLYGDAGLRLSQRPGIIRNHYQLVKCLIQVALASLLALETDWI